MEFIAATMRSPWAFVRNTDTVHGVKVVAEEAGFLAWRADPHRFEQAGSFERLKRAGFASLTSLQAFMEDLAAVVADRGDDLDGAAADLAARPSSEPLRSGERGLEPADLRAFARAFMDDLHDYCLVWRFEGDLDPAQVDFNHALRSFRRGHRWLMRDFGEADRLERRVEADGSTLASAFRQSPDGSEAVLLITNLEGEPFDVVPADLPVVADAAGAGAEGWRVAVASPRLGVGDDLWEPVRLVDSAGVLYYREQ